MFLRGISVMSRGALQDAEPSLFCGRYVFRWCRPQSGGGAVRYWVKQTCQESAWTYEPAILTRWLSTRSGCRDATALSA